MTATEYRKATHTAASNPVTTHFAYTWHTCFGEDTFQIETMTTTLPAVPASENGDAQTGTTQVNYDQYGFMTGEVDAVRTKTVRTYYLATGAVRQMIQDAGPGRLNLTTDYTADPLGRTVLALEPAHTVSLGGATTSIRQVTWTQYLDTLDVVRTIQGYVKTSDGSAVTVNPVSIQRNFVADPVLVGGRMTESIAARYTGGGVQPETMGFDQADFVRWSTQHFTRENEVTHSRLYHLIPSGGPGTNGVNYAQTDYGYDSAGRQNQVTSPGGTISLVEYNAMSWTMQTSTGTTLANLVVVSANEYDHGLDRGDENLTKTTGLVDGDTGKDRVTLFRYDWRNRQTETEANDGTRTILSVSTYDNRGNVTKAQAMPSLRHVTRP